ATTGFVPRTVMLRDRFEQKLTKLLKADSLCNPTARDGNPALDRATGLRCYRIADVPGQPRFAPRDVTIDDALGHELRTVSRAQSFCTPVNVDLTPSSAILDRIKCYRVRPNAAAAPLTRPRCALMDRFCGKPVGVLKLIAFFTPVH